MSLRGNSVLYTTEITVPMASIGPPNPLPPLGGVLEEPPIDLTDPSIPPDFVDSTAMGEVNTPMPYLLLDGYGRDRTPTSIPALVLENEHLQATFLPGYGGRLWSLRHLPSGRDIVFSNNVLQPANLGVRDAWFAGGIEWNVSLHGHCALTCEPLFCGTIEGPDGTPVLRIWEYERLRGVVYSITFWLPPGSPVLYAHGRISNPRQEVVPAYFWANVAVPETEDTRIILPAQQAFWTTPERALQAVPFPVREEVDFSYPARTEYATETFYALPKGKRPWIAALQKSGVGLVQTSTVNLQGRKTFAWGNSPGPRHLQSWLTGSTESRYCEFQSGLTRTQYDYIPLAPGAEYSWTEAFAPLEVAPEVVQQDWDTAVATVEWALEAALPAREVEGAHQYLSALASVRPAAILSMGSGWGALEQARHVAQGTPWQVSEGTPFPCTTLGDQQRPWLALLETGELPVTSPAEPPQSYMLHPEWRQLIVGSQVSWLREYLLGTIAHAEGELDTADTCYARSLKLAPNPWALRAQSLIRYRMGDTELAIRLLEHAHLHSGGSLPMAIELASWLLEADAARCLKFLQTLPETVLAHPRFTVIHAHASLRDGNDAPARRLLAQEFEIPNRRPPEKIIENLWMECYPGRQLPDRLKFRGRPVEDIEATQAP